MPEVQDALSRGENIISASELQTVVLIILLLHRLTSFLINLGRESLLLLLAAFSLLLQNDVVVIIVRSSSSLALATLFYRAGLVVSRLALLDSCQ